MPGGLGPAAKAGETRGNPLSSRLQPLRVELEAIDLSFGE